MKFKMFLILMLTYSTVFARGIEVDDISVIPSTTIVNPPSSQLPPSQPVPDPVTPGPGIVVVSTPTSDANPSGVVIVDPTNDYGHIVIEPENPNDPSFHQEETFVFFSTGNKTISKGYYGFNKKGKLSAVERPITVSGTVVFAVCGLNKNELKGREYLVVNGIISSSPLCTYNKNNRSYNKFVSQTLYQGDKIAIWTNNSTTRKHEVILKMYNSNLGD